MYITPTKLRRGIIRRARRAIVTRERCTSGATDTRRARGAAICRRFATVRAATTSIEFFRRAPAIFIRLLFRLSSSDFTRAHGLRAVLPFHHFLDVIYMRCAIISIRIIKVELYQVEWNLRRSCENLTMEGIFIVRENAHVAFRR